MYCFKCGEKIGDNAVFCRHCGAKQEIIESENVTGETGVTIEKEPVVEGVEVKQDRQPVEETKEEVTKEEVTKEEVVKEVSNKENSKKVSSKRTLERVFAILAGIFGFGAAMFGGLIGGLAGAFGDAESGALLGSLAGAAVIFSIIAIVAGIIVNKQGKLAGLFMITAAVGGFISVSMFFIVPGILLLIAGIMSLRKENQSGKKVKWLIWIPIAIATIVLTFVIAMTNSDGNNDKAYEESDNYMGENIEVDHLSYRVNSVGAYDTVTNALFTEDASGVFLVIDITVKNIDNESETVDTSMLTIIDEDGDEYDAHSSATDILNEDLFMFLEELNPNLSTNGLVAFDVPDLDQLYTLKVEGGMFSIDEDYIVLMTSSDNAEDTSSDKEGGSVNENSKDDQEDEPIDELVLSSVSVSDILGLNYEDLDTFADKHNLNVSSISYTFTSASEFYKITSVSIGTNELGTSDSVDEGSSIKVEVSIGGRVSSTLDDDYNVASNYNELIGDWINVYGGLAWRIGYDKIDTGFYYNEDGYVIEDYSEVEVEGAIIIDQIFEDDDYYVFVIRDENMPYMRVKKLDDYTIAIGYPDGSIVYYNDIDHWDDDITANGRARLYYGTRQYISSSRCNLYDSPNGNYIGWLGEGDSIDVDGAFVDENYDIWLYTQVYDHNNNLIDVWLAEYDVND